METIELVLRILLVIDAIALIGLVMIQQGRGASMGAAFGSGASQTMFGSAGASSFLTSLTAWLAAAFFALTFGLAWSARERAEALGTAGIPEVPAAEAPAPEPAPEEEFEVPALDAEVPSRPESGDGGGDVPALENGAADEATGAASEVPETKPEDA
jgi:preprotein translocase subunit SecG